MNERIRTIGGKKVDIAELARLWNETKLSAGEIAERLGGISRNAVIGHVHRHKDIFKSRAKTPTYSRFGGVPPKARKPSPDSEVRGKKIRNIHQARIEAARREAEEFQVGTSPLLQMPLDDTLRLATGKTLVDLGPHECHWPLNNGGPYLYCADAAAEGTAYCALHAHRARQKLEA